MNATHRSTFRVMASVCLLATGAACRDLLDEHPQTFVDPASYFKTGAQAIAAVNGIYAGLMTWDAWIDPANTPARATVEARLATPRYLVEIMVEASRPARYVAAGLTKWPHLRVMQTRDPRVATLEWTA